MDQNTYVFSPQIGLRWIGAFAVITVILMIHNLGWDVGLPLILMFMAGCFLIGSFIAIIRQVETSREEAETARQESQKLLAELQDAHEQLQALVMALMPSTSVCRRMGGDQSRVDSIKTGQHDL